MPAAPAEMPQIQPLSSCGEPPLQKKISICFIIPCRLRLSLRLFCFSRLASRRGTGTSLSLLPPSLIGGSLRKSYCTMSTTAQSSSFLLFTTRLSPREENPAAEDRLCAFADTIYLICKKQKAPRVFATGGEPFVTEIIMKCAVLPHSLPSAPISVLLRARFETKRKAALSKVQESAARILRGAAVAGNADL